MLTLGDCRPGALVECIDSTGCPELTRGGLYTVEDVRFAADREDDWGVRFRELAPPKGYGGFSRDRFRIVPDERLAVFRAMLQSAAELERLP